LTSFFLYVCIYYSENVCMYTQECVYVFTLLYRACMYVYIRVYVCIYYTENVCAYTQECMYVFTIQRMSVLIHKSVRVYIIHRARPLCNYTVAKTHRMP